MNIMKQILSVCAALLLASGAFAETTANVTVERAGESVNLTGNVISFNASRSATAPNSFMLRDSAGQTRVAVWPDVFAAVVGREGLVAGAQVSVKGEVAEFKGRAEVHVKDPAGLKIGAAPAGAAIVAKAAAPVAAVVDKAATALTSAPLAAGGTIVTATTVTANVAAAAVQAVVGGAPAAAGITPLGAITADRKGQTVTVRGTVLSARKPRTDTAPYVINLQGTDGGTLDMVFWKDTADQLKPTQQVNVGDQVQATGEVNEHRETLQLKLAGPDSLKTQKSDPALFSVPGAAPAAPAAPAPPTGAPQASATGISGASAFAQAAVNSRAVVEGLVVKVEPIHLGRKVQLRERSGANVNLLMWDTADSGNPAVRHLVANSSQIEVAGVVLPVEGTNTLVVSSPEEIVSVVQ